MTKVQLFSAVGGIGDDLVTRPTAHDDAPAASPETRKRIRRRITAAVAACLVLAFVGAILIQIDLNYFVASCAGSPGSIHGGLYYYKDTNSGIYVYDPATGESDLVISELFHDLDGARVNGYGVYYTVADRHHLKVRVHETGEIKTLYKASASDWTHTRILEIYEDAVIFTLYNKDQELRTIFVLDAQTGEVLETLADRVPYGYEGYVIPYPVGERGIGKTVDLTQTDLRHLVEDGEPILVDDHYLTVGDAFGHNLYAGDSLIAGYWRIDGGRQFVLLRPNGENLLIAPDFEVYGGTNDYLFGRPLESELHAPLYAYDIATGETLILLEDYRMQELTTDGTYLYATAPWSSHTDVYRLDYAEGGTLTGATLIDTIGDE